MHCHTTLMAEHHFVFGAFRICIGKEGEMGSGEIVVRIQHLQWEAYIHFGDFIW